MENFDFEVTIATWSFQKDLYNVLCFDYLKRVKSAFLKNIRSNQILKEKIITYLGTKLVFFFFFFGRRYLWGKIWIQKFGKYCQIHLTQEYRKLKNGTAFFIFICLGKYWVYGCLKFFRFQRSKYQNIKKVRKFLHGIFFAALVIIGQETS